LLRSMTGYGEAHVPGDGFELTIEIKSVNNRFLKVSSKLSEEITHLQNEVEEEVRRLVDRGSIFLIIIFRPTRFTDLYEIDEGVLRKYLTSLRRLRKDLNDREEVLLKDILLLPGVVRAQEDVLLGKGAVLPATLRGVREATEKMIAMRETEGQNLEKDFRSRSKLLRGLLADVAACAPKGILDYQVRMHERINRLLAGREMPVLPQDIVKEVAIIAERSDITEELDRMASHLDQFEECLKAQEPIGRKLEFLIQEMFRESNTMASKSISSELSRHLVEIKSEVDRLKEQIQNLE